MDGGGPVPARGRKAVVFDFDGTLTMEGRPLKRELVDALLERKNSGMKILLATGRCVKDIIDLAGDRVFDGVVAENGAVLVSPEGKRSVAPDGWTGVRAKLLPHFEPGCEEVIISAPVETLEMARSLVPADMAQIELNKDRLMIMPKGVDKGTGLTDLLRILRIPSEETTCIGDGENDMPMFEASGFRVALANSVDSLKQRADYVTRGSDGEGTVEALDRLFPRGVAPRRARGIGE